MDLKIKYSSSQPNHLSLAVQRKNEEYKVLLLLLFSTDVLTNRKNS
jgi:hypothetical protein